MVQYIAIGTLLGLSAGFAPGPLLTLVISETLRYGERAGLKVAVAPIITDLPIILLTFLILTRLHNFHGVLGIVSLIGGCVVAFMGYDSLRAKPVELDLNAPQPKSLLKGILTNTLSPHPYLFWLSVGGPTIARAMQEGYGAPLAFVVSFYIFLVGSKIALAILTGKSKAFLGGTLYRVINGLLGLALLGLALVLVYDGIKLLSLTG